MTRFKVKKHEKGTYLTPCCSDGRFLIACGKDGDGTIVRTSETVLEDGSVITHGYNKNDVHISEIVEGPDGSVLEHKYDNDGNHVSEIAKMPDGSVYEHHYDKEGHKISEISRLSDGSYHEFQYDKDGNIVKEIHK